MTSIALETRVAALEEIASTITAVTPREIDTFYIMFAACLVFLMQAGFAMLEAGSVRSKNVRNVLLKNVLDACFGAIIWYLIGFGVSGGGMEFMGTNKDNYALSGLKDTGSDYSSGGYGSSRPLPAAHLRPAPSPRASPAAPLPPGGDPNSARP